MPFREISGHRRLIELLSRSIAHESLPPSLLFSGPAGAGKRLTAIAVAQTLNCPQPVRSPSIVIDACGRCSSCSRIARGVHPDVLVVEPGDSGAIKIEQVRDAVDRTAYRPFEGRRRVVIIDDADAIVPAAQNALLKTLEEPPPASMFILLTSLPDLLLPTVRSRLIRLSFAEGGKLEVDVEARDVAQRVLEHVAKTHDAGRRLEAAKDLLGRPLPNGAVDREQVSSHLLAMATLLRDAHAVSAGADARVLAHPDVKPALEHLGRTFRGDRGVSAFDAVERAIRALNANVGGKVIADWLVLQL
jgi:DNA polymerase III subunit delta'